MGHYKLHCPLEQGDDWALMIDASIQTGPHKCLMVLGVRLSQMKTGKSLALEDLTPLVLEMHTHCNAQTVYAALHKAQLRIGRIQMVCSDQGSDIAAGIRLYQESHPETAYIPDITHRMAKFLKHNLENDQKWMQFCQLAAQTKNRVQQTHLAHLSPPNQRSKCRFMNLEALVGWGKKILLFLERERNNPTHDLKAITEYFGWVHGFADLITLCGEMLEISQEARCLVREEGVHRGIAKKLETALLPLPLCERACQLAGEVIDFLEEQAEKVPEGLSWIGSSEAIESLFGKLKHMEQDQNTNGFTAYVLAAVACVGKIDARTVDQALRQSRNCDITIWEQQNLGITVQAKRKQCLLTREISASIESGPQMVQDISGFIEENLLIAI